MLGAYSANSAGIRPAPFFLKDRKGKQIWRNQPAPSSVVVDAAGNETWANDVTLLSQMLGEPIDRTLQLLIKNESFVRRVDSLRKSRWTTAKLKRYRDRFHCQQDGDYHSLCRHDQRPRILVSFHFGDFLFGLHCLLAEHVTSGSPFLLLSEHPAAAAAVDNLQRIFPKVDVLSRRQALSSRTPVTSLLSFLRQPAATLVCFCDLPPSYGKSSPQLFNRSQIQLPIGPVRLALAAKAPLLPVWTRAVGDQFLVELHPQIETDRGIDAAAISENLARQLDQLVNDSPWQWRFLSRLKEYQLSR